MSCSRVGRPTFARCCFSRGCVVCRDHPAFGGKFGGEDHADGHAFAVEQAVRKACRGFERMAEGVAEIEQRPLARLALVAHHDRGLCAAACGDGVLARRAA
jgi:hypothetical protein